MNNPAGHPNSRGISFAAPTRPPPSTRNTEKRRFSTTDEFSAPKVVPFHSDDGKCDVAMLAEAVSIYERGHSPVAIGEHFGVHAKTVAIRLRHRGVQLRPRRGWA